MAFGRLRPQVMGGSAASCPCEKLELLEAMWEFSAVYPEFVLAGVSLPLESTSWSRDLGAWRPDSVYIYIYTLYIYIFIEPYWRGSKIGKHSHPRFFVSVSQRPR